MAACDGKMRDRTDPVAHPLLVRRVAHGEIAGDGEGGDGFGKHRQDLVERRHVERRLVAVHVVAAGQEEDGIVAERVGQPVALEVLGAEADHDEPGAPALSFHQRIGGERRGERDEADGRDRRLRLRKHRLHSARYADREVVARGERLGAGDDALRFAVEHGVRIGAAGIDAE